jgi:hypothetical protein
LFKNLILKTKMSYKNPPDHEAILAQMKNMKTLGEVKILVDEIFPSWFVTVLSGYSSDYPHLTNNWKKTCEEMGVKPAQIMIVDDFEYGPGYELIGNFAECFTRAGFSVRTKCQFIPCEEDGTAIPSECLYNLLKEKGDVVIPDVWKPYTQGGN